MPRSETPTAHTNSGSKLSRENPYAGSFEKPSVEGAASLPPPEQSPPAPYPEKELLSLPPELTVVLGRRVFPGSSKADRRLARGGRGPFSLPVGYRPWRRPLAEAFAPIRIGDRFGLASLSGARRSIPCDFAFILNSWATAI
jgi:hypothetical protein